MSCDGTTFNRKSRHQQSGHNVDVGIYKKGIEAMGMTNGERIRGMSDEELATLFLFFAPTNFDRAMHTGISGKYTRTPEETFDNNLEWLKQPVED